MKKLFRLLNLTDESGAVLVVVAITMVALLGFTALAIDGGRLYSEKSQLQNALDAAVLAGAQGLKTSEERAIGNAVGVSQRNGVPLTESDLTLTNDSIKAVKKINIPLTFARVLGINNTVVSAKAKAVVAPLKKANGIVPIAIEQKDVPHKTIINCGDKNPGEQYGNCGYLRIDGSGAKDLEDAIKNGVTYEVGTPVSTETGYNTGPVGDAVDFLIESDKSKAHCQNASTADNSCKRVITIVVIETWDGINGHKPVTPIGFASYWVEKYEDKKLYGHFTKMVSPGEIGSGTAIGEYNLYGVKLVE